MKRNWWQLLLRMTSGQYSCCDHREWQQVLWGSICTWDEGSYQSLSGFSMQWFRNGIFIWDFFFWHCNSFHYFVLGRGGDLFLCGVWRMVLWCRGESHWVAMSHFRVWFEPCSLYVSDLALCSCTWEAAGHESQMLKLCYPFESPRSSSWHLALA